VFSLDRNVQVMCDQLLMVVSELHSSDISQFFAQFTEFLNHNLILVPNLLQNQNKV